MEDLIYNKTKRITAYGGDTLVYRNAHVVKMEGVYNSCYIVTLTSSYYGYWTGNNPESISYVYENKDEAIRECEDFLKDCESLNSWEE